MTDPGILSIVSFVFALLAAYSLYTGLRQARDARRVGRPLRWYKHLSLLTGIEYALLTFVFLLKTASLQGLIAPGMQYLVGLLYIVLLVPAAITAGLVIYRVLMNMRTGQARRAAPLASASVAAVQAEEAPQERTYMKKQKEEQAQRQRERRKKAAAARRRQAGKA